MADDKQIMQELEASEQWLSGVCPKNITDSELNLDLLKRHVRLAVQEAWLARELETSDRAPDSLSASISGRIKQRLSETDTQHTTEQSGKLRWLFQPWRLGALASAAVIGFVAVGLGLYYPSTNEGNFELLDSLFEDSPFSNDLDMSLTALTDELDDFSWTLQSPDDDIDGDILYTKDQFDAANIGETLFSSGIES